MTNSVYLYSPSSIHFCSRFSILGDFSLLFGRSFEIFSRALHSTFFIQHFNLLMYRYNQFGYSKYRYNFLVVRDLPSYYEYNHYNYIVSERKVFLISAPDSTWNHKECKIGKHNVSVRMSVFR